MRTVHAAQATFATIKAAQEEAGVEEVSLLNFALSDGATLIATRYVSHEHEEAASLYYAEGSAFQVRLQSSVQVVRFCRVLSAQGYVLCPNMTPST